MVVDFFEISEILGRDLSSCKNVLVNMSNFGCCYVFNPYPTLSPPFISISLNVVKRQMPLNIDDSFKSLPSTLQEIANVVVPLGDQLERLFDDLLLLTFILETKQKIFYLNFNFNVKFYIYSAFLAKRIKQFLLYFS